MLLTCGSCYVLFLCLCQKKLSWINVSFLLNFLYECFSFFSNNPIVLGESHANLPMLIQIISEALYHEALDKDEEVKQRVLSIARRALVRGRKHSCWQQIVTNCIINFSTTQVGFYTCNLRVSESPNIRCLDTVVRGLRKFDFSVCLMASALLP